MTIFPDEKEKTLFLFYSIVNQKKKMSQQGDVIVSQIDQVNSALSQAKEFDDNFIEYLSLKEKLAAFNEEKKVVTVQLKALDQALMNYMQANGRTSITVGNMKLSIVVSKRKKGFNKENIGAALRDVIEPSQVHGVLSAIDSKREVQECCNLRVCEGKKFTQDVPLFPDQDNGPQADDNEE